MSKRCETIIIVLLLAIINGSVLFTYSSYKSTKTGSASIQGASWSVTSSGDKSSITLTAGVSEQTYTLNVQNGSEVDVKYSIVLSNLPAGVKVKLDNGSFVTESSNTVTFSNAGELLYGGTTSRNHTLTFSVPITSSEVSNQNVPIKVQFAQKLS